MATFMVERYLPGAGSGEAAAADLLAKQVAMHVRAEGATVRHLQSLFVPQGLGIVRACLVGDARVSGLGCM
jgi:hypothetical protein